MQSHEASLDSNVFIGIDIHKKSWTVAIRTDIAEHKVFNMPPQSMSLIEYVTKMFPNHTTSVAYEVGCCGFSAAREFLKVNWNTFVVNPADIPRSHKLQFQKTDKIDARYLAKCLQLDLLKSVCIPSPIQDEMKAMIRHRNQITKSIRKIKNYIKSALLYHGIEIPAQFDNANWSIEFKKWLKAVQWKSDIGKMAFLDKIETLEFLHKKHLNAANQVRAYCRKNYKQQYYLLKSIPGIGGYTAAAILAECGDISRFDNEKQFSSFIGIIPGIHISGENQTQMGITPRCKSLLRSYLIESAWIALRKDPEMQLYYRKHYGKNPKAIVVKIAHKLVKRILSVIKNQKPYEINYSLNQTKSHS